MNNFQNIIDAGLVLASAIPPVKEFIITFPNLGPWQEEVSWDIKRGDGTAVINGTTTVGIGTQNVSATELDYTGSYVLNMVDAYGDTWNGTSISISSTDANDNVYPRLSSNGPENNNQFKISPLFIYTITSHSVVVRGDLQSMIALGHTIPELVARGIYTNQQIRDEFPGVNGISQLITSSYGSLSGEALLNLGYTFNEVDVYFTGISTRITSFTDTNDVTYYEMIIGELVPSIYAFLAATSTIGDSVTSIGDFTFGYATSLTSVTIPSGVTSIGNYAFGKAPSLTSVTFEENSQLTSISEGVFIGSGLTSITIPDTVTSIGNRAFEEATSLTSVTIPSGVTSIGNYAFGKAPSLTSVTFEENSQLTSISEGVFTGSGLTSITIPDTVTSIGDGVFGNATSLTSVTIPSGVTSIGVSAFSSSGVTIVYLTEDLTIDGSEYKVGTSGLFFGKNVYFVKDLQNLVNEGLIYLNASYEVIPKTEVVRNELQSMVALGYTIPQLVVVGIYTNQQIRDEFPGRDIVALTSLVYGSLSANDLLNLGYTRSDLTYYIQLWRQLGQYIGGEAAGDSSGYSVSLSSDGTIVAIGAIGNDGNGSGSGHVRVYQYSPESWTQLGQDIDGEAAGDSSGMAVSLSSDGTIVAIGTIRNDDNGHDSGHVRVYQYQNSSGSWTQLGGDIDGEAYNDHSGGSVSLSSDGTIVAIGARLHDGTNDDDRGHVRVYQYQNSSESWTQLGQDIDGEAAYDSSGHAVSLSSDGTIVAIGSPYNDGNGNGSGHVRVYQYQNSSNSWTQLGGGIVGETNYDYSGLAVSLSSDGTIVAIGAPFNDGNESSSGHVRVYHYSSNSWTQLGGDIDGETTQDRSGESISLSSDGTIVAIGAKRNDDNGDDSGHVRVYQYQNSSNSWTKLNIDIDGEASDDYFGYSVSLSSDGTIVAIGAYRNDGNGNNSGHVRVYNLSLSPPAPICFPSGTPVTTDQGNIAIEKINSHIHTIRGKPIVAITQTRPLQKHIVSIEKDALAKNVPSQATEISLNHKVFYKGQMVKARDLVDVCENVHFIPYNGETLYNVLLEEHDKMMINNLICETLSPKNIMAMISRMNEGREKNRILRELTCIIKKNDVSGYKKLYASLK